MINLVFDFNTGYDDIVEENLLRLFQPTHVSVATGVDGSGNRSSAIRTVLVTDNPDSFVYDVPTYYLRADLLSDPLPVDDAVCRKLTGLCLPHWRSYQVTQRHPDVPTRKEKSTARKFETPPFRLGHTTPVQVADINYTEANISNLAEVLETIRITESYSVDMETYRLDPRSGNICMTVSVAERQAYFIPAELIPRVLPVIKWERVTGHNLKYDLECNQVWPGRIGDDTGIIGSLIGTPLNRRKLSEMVYDEFGYQMVEYEDIVPKDKTLADIPHEQLFFYACEDADWSLRLRNKLRPRLPTDASGVYNIQMRLTPIIAEMEWNGLKTDAVALQKLQATQDSALTAFKNWIYTIAGHEFDLDSWQQVGKVLYDELGIEKKRFTKTGVSTDVVALEQMTHPIAKAILAHRAVEKLKSTYTEPLQTKVHPNTGRVHPNFNMATVASGRLSSSNPNAQNIPKTKVYRDVVIANAPNLLLKIDFDQLELRTLAGMSGGSTMGQVFAQGGDIHAYTASAIYGKPVSALTKGERQQGKRNNFAITYGAAIKKVMEVNGCSYDEASVIREQLFSAYPDELDYMQELRDKGLRERKAVTLYGRTRTFGDFTPADAIEREAANHVIQGSAAELVFVSMIETISIIRRYGAKLINQIHDEVLIECHGDTIEDLWNELVPAMESANKFPVPLVVSAEIGYKWMI